MPVKCWFLHATLTRTRTPVRLAGALDRRCESNPGALMQGTRHRRDKGFGLEHQVRPPTEPQGPADVHVRGEVR
jgi:hypothetical protein